MKIYSDEAIKVKLIRRKKIGKVFFVLLLLLTVFTAICVGTVIVKKLIMHKRIAYVFGYTPFIISSGSMQPELNVYDVIVVKKASEGDIGVGDIITFIDKYGDIVTHRVAEVYSSDGKNHYVTKGDANSANDVDAVTYEDIIGRYSFGIPYGGYIVEAVRSPAGIVTIILIFIAVVSITVKKNSRKAARHSIREEYKQRVVQEKTSTE